MTKEMQTAADMIAIYFAGVAKTQNELRDAIFALADTSLFSLTPVECEIIARDNEAKQGFRLF